LNLLDDSLMIKKTISCGDKNLQNVI